jgi:hypothetical protein
MAQLEWVGKHSVGIEDDTLLITFDGFLTATELTQLIVIAERLMAGRNDLFVLADSRAAGASEPEVRKLLVEWFKEHGFSAVASYGGSPISRAISALIVNAVRLVNKKILPIAFFKTEEEARPWLALRRQAKLAAGAYTDR